ncbi:hypothetical protein T492DRAFT_928075 [Pavlovales sp. CCMP2436]|nr:hypothetical protein T492DRAFT_928075 [Pavlovales sp. CCMP2436]
MVQRSRAWLLALLASCALLCAHALSPAPTPFTRRSAVLRSIATVAAAPSALALALPCAAMAEEMGGGADEDRMEAAVVTLREAYAALDQADPERAESLFSNCIDEWKSMGLPGAETASLLRLRASARMQLTKPAGALADLDAAYALASKAGVADEVLQILQLRALTLEGLSQWKRAEADLSELLRSELDLSVGGPNPFLRLRRAQTRQHLGNWAGAATDLADAEVLLKEVGDQIRSVLATASLALAHYGAGDTKAFLACTKKLFEVYTKPGSNNPDDLPLLEELSRREAELHLALASHIGGAREPPSAEALARAGEEWSVGCLRLRVYADSLAERRTEEDRRRIAPSPIERASRELARLTGLAPDSPYVTMLPGEGYWWYQEIGATGSSRRRSPLNVRAPLERKSVSCSAFEDCSFALKERDWPDKLVERLAVYRQRVKAAQLL